jgi:hypothetical protein
MRAKETIFLFCFFYTKTISSTADKSGLSVDDVEFLCRLFCLCDDWIFV